MEKHTPGPWAVEDPMHDILCVVVGEEPAKWCHIAQLALSDGDVSEVEARANAALIAAAPDMLAALEAAWKFIGERGPGNPYLTEPGKTVANAIAKARGQGPSGSKE